MAHDVGQALQAEHEIGDAELASKAKCGNIDAFGELVERYKERAYMIALGFVGNPDDAMDLSQEAFVKAFRAIRTFKDGRDFYPWFYAVLRNTCFNFLRRRKTRKESSLDAAQEYGFDVVDGAPDPAATLEHKEMRELVRAEMGNLAPVHKEILLLRHYELLSYKEMAGVLGCPIGTVMSRLYAARQALKVRLTRYMTESGDTASGDDVGDGRGGR
ncbi:MAG: sigma-70 family RNA polymerase sigma factor, partial [Candidatus Eisenbacteria bacterium]|nr:sigma-70 family RNA polymerase sigma factor [Candidatus Eisenbacteria bacterium]